MQLRSPSRSDEGAEFINRDELPFGLWAVGGIVSVFLPFEEYNWPFLEVGDASR
jgi:hypothetical protein